MQYTIIKKLYKSRPGMGMLAKESKYTIIKKLYKSRQGVVECTIGFFKEKNLSTSERKMPAPEALVDWSCILASTNSIFTIHHFSKITRGLLKKTTSKPYFQHYCLIIQFADCHNQYIINAGKLKQF